MPSFTVMCKAYFDRRLESVLCGCVLRNVKDVLSFLFDGTQSVSESEDEIPLMYVT